MDGKPQYTRTIKVTNLAQLISARPRTVCLTKAFAKSRYDEFLPTLVFFVHLIYQTSRFVIPKPLDPHDHSPNRLDQLSGLSETYLRGSFCNGSIVFTRLAKR